MKERWLTASHRRSRHERRFFQFTRGHVHGSLVHGLGIRQRRARHRGYRSGNLLVRIVNMHVVVVPVDVDAVVRNVRRVLGDIGRVVVDDGRIVFGNRRRVVAVYVVAVDIRRVVRTGVDVRRAGNIICRRGERDRVRVAVQHRHRVRTTCTCEGQAMRIQIDIAIAQEGILRRRRTAKAIRFRAGNRREDDTFVRSATCELLRWVAFEVLEAGNAAAARDIFGCNPARIDVVFCDITLPDGSGVELCRKQQFQRKEG